ncbi:Beta-lactamase-like protein 3 [Stylophora pistillata]|uniref:Beta-lactamase-like protein 3 n=1 Tax=Stylophora pistillata TaxID=50429 RepID=A0A2B4SEU1_STYPI|nr:Beta-lactamase-like protein 3 [Stylophora pistillata]
MTVSSDDSSATGASQCVVSYPDVSSSREAKTIARLKLALELVALGFLTMTVLFIWQITKKRPDAAVQNPTVDPSTAEVGMTANVVYQDSVVWRKNYGLKDKNHLGVSPDQDTVFRVASITKIFTAIFVFKLLETGRIDCLDDPLEKYEPRFQVRNSFNQQKITIRQILAHTSGLPREVPCSDAYSYGKTHVCPVNNTYVLEQLSKTELKSPPGRLPHYRNPNGSTKSNELILFFSNLGYSLIARIFAEKFANSDYEGWVERNIFQPLGMGQTGFNLRRMPSNMAVGYDDDGEAPLVDWDWAAPAIQAYSTANDLYKLMTFLLGMSSASLLNRELVQQLMKPDFMYPDGSTVFGTGWEIIDAGTYSVVTKSGFVPGYSAGFAFVPEFKLGAIALVSGREVAWRLVLSIVQTLAKKMDAVLLRQQLQIQLLSNNEQYLGEYRIVSHWMPEVIVNITQENGLLLFTQLPGSLGFSYLKPITDHVFEVIYRAGLDCMTYGLGQNRERVSFDPPSSDKKSPGLKFGPYIFKRMNPEYRLVVIQFCFFDDGQNLQKIVMVDKSTNLQAYNEDRTANLVEAQEIERRMFGSPNAVEVINIEEKQEEEHQNEEHQTEEHQNDKMKDSKSQT